MGAFVIYKNQTSSKNVNEIRHLFEQRGYGNPIEFKNEKFHLLYFPKFNGTAQYLKSKDGAMLCVVGTLWYDDVPFLKASDRLLYDFASDKINLNLLKGTYCIIYVPADQQKKIKLVHDPKGVFRFYTNQNKSIISSSWLGLAKLSKSKELDPNIIIENIILGFILGTKTLIQGINRVLFQENITSDIEYIRRESDDLGYQNKPIVTNLKTAIASSNNILSNVLVPKILSYSNTILGLSSGYDSRLLVAILEKHIDEKLSFFTFYKPGDNDLKISKIISAQLNKNIKIVESELTTDTKDHSKIYHDAFMFFDGQAIDMIHYSKPDYTKQFRENLIGNYALHLSGVGGELFRNYAHDHFFRVEMKKWIFSRFLWGVNQNHSKFFLDQISRISEELKQYLQLSKDHITYSQRRRFYGEIFLRDWHGVRNSIENQYSNYYSPFTDPEIINLSYQTLKYQGYGGSFEAAMIKSASRDMASIQSDYGHNFLAIPFRIKMANTIRSLIKLPIFSTLRKLKGNKNSQLSLSDYELYLHNKWSEHLNQYGIPTVLIYRKKDLVLAIYQILEEFQNDAKSNTN